LSCSKPPHIPALIDGKMIVGNVTTEWLTPTIKNPSTDSIIILSELGQKNESYWYYITICEMMPVT